MKPCTEAARRIAEELKINNPKRKSLKDEEILIGRLLCALFYNSAMVRKVTSSTTGTDWHDFDFVHKARRSRRKGTHRHRWTRKQAWDLMREIEGLAYNLYEIGELAGISPNPYPDTEDSIAPWR